MFSLFQTRSTDPAPTAEIVPTVFPKVTGANLGAAFVGKRLAGDFYDSVRVSPERVLIGLLDVAGRRDDNRGLLTAAQQIFRESGAELFSRPDMNESTAMSELCLRLNRGMIERASGVHSCPAFLACYHEVFGTLCYTNAGHTPGLLRGATGITELASTGLPLGLFSHATSDAPTVAVEKNGALLLVSRGVIECEGHKANSGKEFTLEGVKQVFQADSSSSAESLCTAVLDAVGKFSAGVAPCDDRTALALSRTD